LPLEENSMQLSQFMMNVAIQGLALAFTISILLAGE
jgi:hypothetical protein